MLQIHPNARTTPVTRAEIARSAEQSSALAKRYGVSTETIRKWRKRGVADCQDHSARPHHLPWRATEEERAVVCAVRQSTNFPLDDLTFVVTHFLPHLNRDSIWRILRSEGLSRRRPPVASQPTRGRTTSGTMISASFTSISSIYPSCRPLMANDASATSLLPSTGDPVPCIWRSRMMKPRRVPLPSCGKPQQPFLSGSLTC